MCRTPDLSARNLDVGGLKEQERLLSRRAVSHYLWVQRNESTGEMCTVRMKPVGFLYDV